MSLDIHPSMMISLEQFTESYPNGEVLSTETGQDFEYGKNPYIDYDNIKNEQPRLFKGTVDDRLPAMARIINIRSKGKSKIYPVSIIKEKEVINDEYNDQTVVFFYDDGMTSVLDEKDITESRKIGSVTVFEPLVNGRQLTFRKNKGKFIDEETLSTWDITGTCLEGELKGKKLRPLIFMGIILLLHGLPLSRNVKFMR